ncbi:NAD(P)H-hydrate dehydratase [Puteibacter caeruleilacunae]|nr:NAD(P)H-hydrate dehydratase [Puteibacter caeruleilacunae]
MKIFTCKQIAEIDQYTIQHEPIADIDLMERASKTAASWITQNVTLNNDILIFSGPGNNGGDALAIARMLASSDFNVTVCQLDTGKPLSGSPATNMNRLQEQKKVQTIMISSVNDIPIPKSEYIIIDGLFGSGLNRPLQGLPLQIVEFINNLNKTVIAIDIPSGLMGEDNTTNSLAQVIKATHTLTFQFPKLSFLFAEWEACLGNLHVLSIGLHPDIIEEKATPYQSVTSALIQEKLQIRTRHSHKGTFGHALLIAGSYGKMGAAVLASKACLRAGVGLLTTHVPHLGYQILQNTVPEAMISIDRSDLHFTEFPDTDQYKAIGIGPGLGCKMNSIRAMENLLEQCKKPMVIDADGLNILSGKKELLAQLPTQTILTPHPKEFERLAGPAENSFERLQKQVNFSNQHNVITLVKGAHTTITTPDGQCFFNTSGNPGMATAGSGDVLTGIILGLLAQGYSPIDAALVGVFLHGISGDIALNKQSVESLIASDIIENLGFAFKEIKN